MPPYHLLTLPVTIFSVYRLLQSHPCLEFLSLSIADKILLFYMFSKQMTKEVGESVI